MWSVSTTSSVVRDRLLGDFPELNAVTVAPELRSQGIGTALIREAERRVAPRGLACVGLAVGVDNPRARSLYERLGYRTWAHGTLEVSWPCPARPAASRRPAST